MQRFRREKISTSDHKRPRGRRLAGLLAVSLGLLTGLVAGPNSPVPTVSAQAPVGQGFNLNKSDLNFILKQIRIAEKHSISDRSVNLCNGILGPDPLTQIPDNQVGTELPFGLRTVDGTCNNLLYDANVSRQPDEVRRGRPVLPAPRPGAVQVACRTTTPVTTGAAVVDPEPRRISNLIVDQTATNPAAVAAAGPDPEITPSGAFFIPNVAPDVGLSAPYNSWFTLFGQFFDHGLDLVNKGGTNGNAGIVFVPLDESDPLFGQGPNFMVLTRATHVNGEATNQTTPFVDQSQTYTSHPSHQVFLRDYNVNELGQPVQSGRLITGPGDGMGTWADVKTQALDVLGIEFTDMDVFNIPVVATDPYGHFIPDPATGFPQLVIPDDPATLDVNESDLISGTPGAPITTAGTLKTGHAFLDDIAHNAVPRTSGGLPLDPDEGDLVDPVIIDGVPQPRPAGTYDDELLDAHFIAGDGRVNENIGLTAVHHIFHSEHNRLVGVINGMLQDPLLFQPTELAGWTEVSDSARRLELRGAPVPGRPVRHRDGVPAPGVRGVHPQGAADGQRVR